MDDADRQIDRLVFVNDFCFFAARHFRRAFDDDPVFGAVIVALQRQPLARRDHYPFDLIARALIDRLVIAPGPIHAFVLGRFAALALAQMLDQRLDLIALVVAHHQNRVLRRDDDHVLDAENGGEQAAGADMHIVGVESDALAIDRIAARVAFAELPDRVPVADVRPADVGGHHGGAACALHDRVIDGFLRRLAERLRVEREKAEITLGVVDRGGRRLEHVGFVGAQFLDHRIGAKEEVAGIPEITRGDIAFGDRARGLFDEGFDARGCGAGDRRARFDVTIADRRLGRLHAESDDVAEFGRTSGGGADGEKFGLFGYDVVGGEHRDDGLRILASRQRRGDRDRWPGVAPDRLGDDSRLDADLGELLAHEEAVVVVGDDDGGRELRARDPQHGILEGRARADQSDELLGHRLARFRPDPRSRAAAHDDR